MSASTELGELSLQERFLVVFETITNGTIGQRSFRPNSIQPADQIFSSGVNETSLAHVELLLDIRDLIGDSPVEFISFLNREANNKQAALFDKLLCWEAIYYLNREKYDTVHVNLTDHSFGEHSGYKTLITISYIVRNFLQKGKLLFEISENVELNLDILERFPDLNFVIDDVTSTQFSALLDFVNQYDELPKNLEGLKIDGDIFSLAFGEPISEAQYVQRGLAFNYIKDVFLFCQKYDLDFIIEGIETETLEGRVLRFFKSFRNDTFNFGKIYLQGYLYDANT